jgi:hypothetical protein
LRSRKKSNINECYIESEFVFDCDNGGKLCVYEEVWTWMMYSRSLSDDSIDISFGRTFGIWVNPVLSTSPTSFRMTNASLRPPETMIQFALIEVRWLKLSGTYVGLCVSPTNGITIMTSRMKNMKITSWRLIWTISSPILMSIHDRRISGIEGSENYGSIYFSSL